MKKAKRESDELRREYKRSELGPIERGRYARRIAAESNVVVLEPAVAQVFRNDRAVNDALRSLIEIAKVSSEAVRPVRKKVSRPTVAPPA